MWSTGLTNNSRLGIVKLLETAKEMGPLISIIAKWGQYKLTRPPTFGRRKLSNVQCPTGDRWGVRLSGLANTWGQKIDELEGTLVQLGEKPQVFFLVPIGKKTVKRRWLFQSLSIKKADMISMCISIMISIYISIWVAIRKTMPKSRRWLAQKLPYIPLNHPQNMTLVAFSAALSMRSRCWKGHRTSPRANWVLAEATARLGGLGVFFFGIFVSQVQVRQP